MRVTLADVGQTVQLDAIASMCAIAEGRITGDDARYVAALVASVEEAEGLLSRDDMDLDEYMASHGRLLEAGFIGYDEHGGYLTAPAGAPAGFAELLKS